MQQLAQRKPHQRAQRAEREVFREHIGRRFAQREAQHLDRSDLANALRDVDIRQVEQHDERQRRRAQDHHDHYGVQAGHHIFEAAAHLGGHADVAHRLQPRNMCAGLPRILSFRKIDEGGVALGYARPLSGDARAAHDQVIVDVVVKYAGQAQRHALHLRIVHRERIADLRAEALRKTGIDDALALIREIERRFAAVQSNEIRNIRPIADDDVHGARLRAERYVCRTLVNEQCIAQLCAHFISEIGLRLRILRIDKAHGRIVDHNLAELIVGQIGNGIVDAEPRDHQRRAAADTDDHHQQPLLIAEGIAQRDLGQERQPAPDEADALQQDTPAGLGRLRTNQLRGHIRQLRAAGKPCGTHGAQQRRAHRQRTQQRA